MKITFNYGDTAIDLSDYNAVDVGCEVFPSSFDYDITTWKPIEGREVVILTDHGLELAKGQQGEMYLEDDKYSGCIRQIAYAGSTQNDLGSFAHTFIGKAA